MEVSMVYIIRNSDRTIKTYLEKGDDCVLQPGETMEVQPVAFRQYAERLKLSVNGRGGELIRAQKGSGALEVRVEAPLTAEIELEINGTVETVSLTDGVGVLRLGTEEAGLFLVQPRDRTTYCAAGEALLAVEVME
jgi:hypothetical protein